MDTTTTTTGDARRAAIAASPAAKPAPRGERPLAERLQACTPAELASRRDAALAMLAGIDVEVRRRLADATALQSLLSGQ